jgi:hypothetical protein
MSLAETTGFDKLLKQMETKFYIIYRYKLRHLLWLLIGLSMGLCLNKPYFNYLNCIPYYSNDEQFIGPVVGLRVVETVVISVVEVMDIVVELLLSVVETANGVVSNVEDVDVVMSAPVALNGRGLVTM